MLSDRVPDRCINKTHGSCILPLLPTPTPAPVSHKSQELRVVRKLKPNARFRTANKASAVLRGQPAQGDAAPGPRAQVPVPAQVHKLNSSHKCKSYPMPELLIATETENSSKKNTW